MACKNQLTSYFLLFIDPGQWRPKLGDYRDGRDNATIILGCSNVLPFKWRRNVFGCPSCDFTSPDFTCLKNHMTNHSVKSNKLDVLKKSRRGDPIKIDVADLKCDLCEREIDDIPALMNHLHDFHKKPIVKNFDSGLVPYLLGNGFVCAYCGKAFDRFVTLNTHVFNHMPKYACSECGLLFSADRLKKHMLRNHDKTREIKFKPKSGEYDVRHNTALILEFSNICPFKWQRNVYACACCAFTSAEFIDLRMHMSAHPVKPEKLEILRHLLPNDIVKADITDLKCELCQLNIENIQKLMTHLKEDHDKPILKQFGSGIIPYFLRDGFKCAYGSCNELFDSFNKLNMHIKSHNIKYTCAQCGQYFTSGKRMNTHLIRKHGQSQLSKLRSECEKLKPGMRTKFSLYDDARANAAIILEFSNACLFKWHRNVFGCATCDYTAADFGLFRSHVETKCKGLQLRYSRLTDLLKAEVTDLKCKLCDEAFYDLKILLCHLGEIHNKPIKVEHDTGLIPYLLSSGFICAYCGVQFDGFTKLNCHMNEHFPNCVCSYCGQGFTSETRLKYHTWQHKRRMESFKCSVCKENFATRHLKQKHMIAEHGKLTYKCPYCSEMFKSYPLRVQHLNTEHGKKIDYPCKHCSEVFKTSAKRGKHIRSVHRKNELHYCSVCNYTCLTAARLGKHMLKHGSTERNYKCDICFKAYPRRSALSLHMRIHDNDNRFICVYCGAAFVQISSLKSHTKTHHP